MRVAKALAKGDLTQTITKDYPGLFGETKDGVNTTVENLKKLVGEIKECDRHHQHRLQGNRRGQQRPVATHRRTGLQPGRNRLQHGRTDLHREAECRERQTGQPARHRRIRRGRQGRRGGQPGGRHHGLDQRIVAQDRGHHLRDRRHRLPDQHPGAECGRGSGPCRRTGTRLCRGGRRSAQPGATLRRGRQGDQDPDRRLGGQGRRTAPSWSPRPVRPWKKSSPRSSA